LASKNFDLLASLASALKILIPPLQLPFMGVMNRLPHGHLVHTSGCLFIGIARFITVEF
jgi:hypothetical protein